MSTERQRRIARALTATIPRAPFLDAEAIRAAAGARHLRALPPPTALWLAAVAHIRHQHTDYDSLRDEGYDRESARFFVLEDINAVLDRWGGTRRLDPEAGDDEPFGGFGDEEADEETGADGPGGQPGS